MAKTEIVLGEAGGGSSANHTNSACGHGSETSSGKTITINTGVPNLSSFNFILRATNEFACGINYEPALGTNAFEWGTNGTQNYGGKKAFGTNPDTTGSRCAYIATDGYDATTGTFTIKLPTHSSFTSPKYYWTAYKE